MTFLADLFTDPYLPDPGDLYWIDTDILEGRDKKPRRPGVVVTVPATLYGRITVVTRTTKENVSGVRHPAEPPLGLHEPGVFAYLRTAEAQLWRRPRVEWMGRLDEDVLKEVVEEFLG